MATNLLDIESSENFKYDPDALLDAIIKQLRIKNDAALSRILEVAPPVISKIRHRRLPIGASLLIRMNEVTDLSIKELRVLMGDRREKFSLHNVDVLTSMPNAGEDADFNRRNEQNLT